MLSGTHARKAVWSLPHEPKGSGKTFFLLTFYSQPYLLLILYIYFFLYIYLCHSYYVYLITVFSSVYILFVFIFTCVTNRSQPVEQQTNVTVQRTNVFRCTCRCIFVEIRKNNHKNLSYF